MFELIRGRRSVYNNIMHCKEVFLVQHYDGNQVILAITTATGNFFSVTNGTISVKYYK